ncbi:type II toxin-antitoxin system Phd/YefM family antitoxin [Campylobacter lari]|uniref:type II toxin-antitoxin system Phd/YefM family antitoxin n=1 Tax=Campylobacter sp. CNRCH_2015_0814 TaxID=2911606 RepID=UPI001288DEBF|nr:type II toxin-antitoxin system Phd/YefM family antitoxin [Campylobacter sp. CNRCH_2015_0814]EAI7262741.1 type II toxin-antitoxin system Phd/YefM family antitoxin [Campylobacter lari]EAK0436169.1 type II toxin-antitoxin system Phd/YefM family antitoxin [Campylobacter lari]EAK0804540.1 type II toxin-antitoxin system Phd/YefM family antitoxin [Campylobacter lari]EAL9772713.1 type II toxin-antitoxin system Phd/YefM family antitoxin [Campylobacter lari]EGK8057763.1 type II toxin-antitoxin system
MATFSKDEIYTATEVVRNFSAMLEKTKKSENGRVVIVKNNKFEAVLLSFEEYERLNEAVMLLEKIYKDKKG